MGLLDLFFKSRTQRDAGKRVANGLGAGEPMPDPTMFLVPRERAPIVPVFPRPAISEPARPAPSVDSASRRIVVQFADVLAQIPAEVLRDTARELRRELRFGPGEFFADIPRGRVTVSLSNVAAQCPEAFSVPIGDDIDREVRLPLQKVLDQLVAEPASRGAPALHLPAAPASADPAPPDPAEPFIRLSLAAILAGCPDDVFTGVRPAVPESLQVAIPFESIEEQLTGGAVEIAARSLLARLPASFGRAGFLREDATIPLPIEEVFRNLPRGVVVSRPPAPESPAVSAEGRRFFASGSPHLHAVPPPPLLVHPIGESGTREAPASPAAAHEPDYPFARPPLGRPLVVLPPPILDAVEEAPAETTSDQTAVLEYLSQGDEEP